MSYIYSKYCTFSFAIYYVLGITHDVSCTTYYVVCILYSVSCILYYVYCLVYAELHSKTQCNITHIVRSFVRSRHRYGLSDCVKH